MKQVKLYEEFNDITEIDIINELNLTNDGIKDFLTAARNDISVIKKLGFNDFKGLAKYIRHGDIEDWNDLRSEAEGYGLKVESTVVNEAVDKYVQKMVNDFVKKMSNEFGYTSQDAVYAIIDVLKSQKYEGIKESSITEANRDPESIRKEYQELKKASISYLRSEWSRNFKVGNPTGTDKEGLISDLLRAYHGNKYVDAAFESIVTEAAANRIKVTYEEIRTIVDLANASIAAKKNNINGVFGYTLVSIFGDNMDKAESGPVTITVNPKAAGAILTLVDWAEQDKSNVKNTAYAYGITPDNLRKKFAYGEIV